MKNYVIIAIIIINCAFIESSDVLGCGGFIKSHVQIDFSKIDIELHTKQGIIKDRTSCAPNNGYYFIPVYDKGEYVLKLKPPPGWSFTPISVNLVIDGTTDFCSKGKDINFVFKGFGITGKVENFDKSTGPAGITIELKFGSQTHKTLTTSDGTFFFTPVYPGNYNIVASHEKWKFYKNSINVQVTEGNTELPVGSIILGGYDVSGVVKSENRPVENVHLILLQQENHKGLAYVHGCNTEAVKDVSLKAKQLCYVISNSQGAFVFPAVSPGKYVIIPHYKGRNTHFEPKSIEVTVKDDSVALAESFEIVGFTVSGRVLSSKNGRPLKDAKIFLNGEQVGITRENGSFVLQNVKNSYILLIVADKLQFDETTVTVGPSVVQLPDYYPTKYEVCGTVLSSKSESIVIVSADHKSVTLPTSATTGQFCYYLPIGKYKLFVTVSELEKTQHIQFFPTSHSLDVIASPVSGILFSQLKATVKGKVDCLTEKDCKGLTVVVKSITADMSSEDLVVNVIDQSFIIPDVRPGMYEIYLSPNRLCWETDKFVVTINSANEVVQPFVHIGYPVTFISSHSTKAYSKTNTSNSKVEVLDIPKGRKLFCLKREGQYELVLKSCHTYEKSIIEYNTNSDINEIHIEAKKHSITAAISAQDIVKDLYLTIDINGDVSEKGPLVYKDGQYLITLLLDSNEVAKVTPKSDLLYFKPRSFSISGHNDCTSVGTICAAVQGKVFKGKVIPPLPGVIITIESEHVDPLIIETDNDGKYKYPPQDQSKNYKISAKKDTYILVGPNAAGDFVAQKLAEIVVQVVDDKDDTPLQGALLSLSGSESYRSNLQTNTDGKITFHSLSPSEYFLKPMMKEYNFDPSSKMIKVKEGASVAVNLRGKRVAYSCFGQITSLNGEPEERIVIVAEGLGNCSQYSEDANSEPNGHFRIRGLHPYCTYNVSVKGTLLENSSPIERASPASVNLTITSDVNDIKFLVFRPVSTTDVLVHVYSENTELYKQMKVKLSKEAPPPALIHAVKLDNPYYKSADENNIGVVVQLPSIPLNGLLYSIQLEISGSHSNKNAQTQYLLANSSFKYIEMKYLAKEAAAEQNIKQTSLWALAFIFAIFLTLYNLHYVTKFLKEQSDKVNLMNVAAITNSTGRRKSSNEYLIDKDEIDQIVQSINAPKRKTKPRKA